MTENWAASLPRKRMGAAALITDVEGRILCVEPVYKDHWELTGGLAEVGGISRRSSLNSIRLPADELASYDYLDFDRIDGLFPAAMAARLRAAVAAREAGTTIELEAGSPP